MPTGAIADRARAILPVTWDALQRDSRFGDGSLDTALDTAKESVLGIVPAPTAESAYPLIVIDYVAKVASVEIATAGIDFWMSEPISESASGTNENHTFDVRADRLRQLRDELMIEVRQKAGEIADLVGYRRSSASGTRPQINTAGDVFLSPDPQEFPRPFVQTNRS